MPDILFDLRAATADDADALARLLTDLGHPTRADEVPARLTAVLREGGSVVLAVETAGEPLGLIALSKHAVLHASGPVAYITALVTAAAARRSGIGRALVGAARQWAAREGCVRLSVTSAERRADAHAFYPACGLPYTGRRFAAAVEPSPERMVGAAEYAGTPRAAARKRRRVQRRAVPPKVR